MVYEVSRNGRNLGTYTEEGLARLLNSGEVLPTDLVFLEKEKRWVPIAELPRRAPDEVAEFTQKLRAARPRALVTPALVAINVAVFVVMAVAGVSIMNPTPQALLRWGADFGPLVAHGEWWRLLTAAFVHVGILHIALNMWVLFSGGIFTERLFGSRAFLTLYLLSAVGGSLASAAWQPFMVSAGASGAIFGVYGGLVGLLLVQHKSIPKAAVASVGTSAIAFVGYNFLYGIVANSHILSGVSGISNIDLAAHLGGLITGLIAGCALAFRVDPAAGGARFLRCVAVTVVGLALFVPIGLKLRNQDPKQAEAVAMEINGKSLTIGMNDRIVYSGNATEADAIRLGQALKTIGFMKDRGTLVLYTKDQTGSVVSFIVKDEAWQNPRLVSSFNLLGNLIASATGTPLKLRLLNKERVLEKEFVYGQKNTGLMPLVGKTKVSLAHC
jgi:membrane associated rhomboid family serine protease